MPDYIRRIDPSTIAEARRKINRAIDNDQWDVTLTLDEVSMLMDDRELSVTQHILNEVGKVLSLENVSGSGDPVSFHNGARMMANRVRVALDRSSRRVGP